MKKEKDVKDINENLEQLEVELNIENKQSDKADDMIELIEVDDEEYHSEELDEFADVEFVDEGNKKKKRQVSAGYQFFRAVVTLVALFAFGYASYELMLVQLENDTTFEAKDEIVNMFLQDVDNNFENVVSNSNGETIIMQNASDGKAFVWDYQKMLDYNSESVGYIRQGSGEYIDYPVLQHSDNDYYLYHLPNHKWSSIGSIFMDYRIEGGLTADYSILYGHYMGRRVNNIMFGSLNWYWDRPAYHKEHPDFDIYVENRHYKYYVFSIMKVPASGHRVYTLFQESDEDRFAYLQECRAQSKYVFTEAPELTVDSKVVMLSTCTTNEEVRFVMFLVRGEEIYDVPGVDYDNLPEETDPPRQETSSSEEQTNPPSESDDTTVAPPVEDDTTVAPPQATTPEEPTTPKPTTPEPTTPEDTTTPESTTPEPTTPEPTTPEPTTPEPTTPEPTTPEETTTPVEETQSSDEGSSEEQSSEQMSSEEQTAPME